MRTQLTLSLAALGVVTSFVTSTLAHADQDAPLPRRQPYVNVPQQDDNYDNGDQGRYDDQDQGRYQDQEEQAPPQNITIINNNYQAPNQGFFEPGYGGIPQDFGCSVCTILYLGNGLANVVAVEGGYGRGYLLATVPAYQLGPVVNDIQYRGYCSRVYAPPPPPIFYNNGPQVLPFPGPRPGWYGPRPGWGGRGPGFGGVGPVIVGGGGQRPGWGRPGPGFGGPGFGGPRFGGPGFGGPGGPRRFGR